MSPRVSVHFAVSLAREDTDHTFLQHQHLSHLKDRRTFEQAAASIPQSPALCCQYLGMFLCTQLAVWLDVFLTRVSVRQGDLHSLGLSLVHFLRTESFHLSRIP